MKYKGTTDTHFEIKKAGSIVLFLLLLFLAVFGIRRKQYELD